MKSRRAAEPTDTATADEGPSGPVPTVVAAEDPETAAEVDEPDQPPAPRRRIHWTRTLGYAVLPGLTLLLAASVGLVKWQDASARGAEVASAKAVQVATDGTIALLSYQPDTVEEDLEAARSRMTGQFLESYTTLIHDVVIPGAKQRQISAAATVPAAGCVSATRNHAVVLLFVNQTVVVGQDAPTNTASSVRVTVDKVDGQWLISEFDPV